MKGRTILELYDSGSEIDVESESESEYETKDNSDADEGYPCQRNNRASEPSADEFFHNNSKRHTTLLTSDVISTSQHSDITDELQITSLTQQSPPIQMMNRNCGHDSFGTPTSSLNSRCSSPRGSESSGESLFSLQRNSSFTKRHFTGGIILESGEFCHLEELRGSNMNTPNVAVGKSIPRTNVDDDEELRVEVSDERPSTVNHPTSYQKEFVLPLNFPKTTENKKNKKTKTKKKGGCLFCLRCKWPSGSSKCSSCYKCPSWSSCCCKCFTWPSCSCKCFTRPSCSCKCFTWPSCKCFTWPSCSCKCFTWPSCRCKCFTWPSCHCKWPSWSCCKTKSHCLTCC